MSKLALLVGINRYESDAFENLSCCEADAEAVARLVSHHQSVDAGEGGARNYTTRLLTSAGSTRISTETLRQNIEQLMTHPMGEGEVLFYFSGHGVANENGGYLVTQDATPENPGFPMAELLNAANRSGNVSAVIILDCCHSGAIGNITDGSGFSQVSIGPNVTVLAGSGANQSSAEDWEHSLFTSLLIEGLSGGASDVRGEVSAAALYAYIEQSLGPWDQRPVYKSYARSLKPLRRCQPAVPDEVLARIPEWFKRPDSDYQMDPRYEYTHESAEDSLVAIFDQFKLLRNARLLTTEGGKDLYFTALESGSVRLTPQGRLFWKRAKRDEFW
jgi:hypothetical protein